MARNLKQGMPVVQAFDYHWQTLSSTENPGRNWYLAFNVWRNQLQLAKKGASQVPLIISRIALGDNFGVPKAVRRSLSRILLNRFSNEASGYRVFRLLFLPYGIESMIAVKISAL